MLFIMVSRGYFRFFWFLAFLIFFLTGCGHQPDGLLSRSKSGISARVVEVIDGDTVRVEFLPGPGGSLKNRVSGPHSPVQLSPVEKVRLIGVNAPETGGKGQAGELFGLKAKEYTKERLLNQMVTLEFDVVSRDRYGRLLAYIYSEKNLFNCQLVRDGYAQVYTSPPNLLHLEELLAAQREAIHSGRGLWGVRDFYSGRVVGNRRSFVYHRPGCTHLPSLANRVWFDSEKEAVLAGYHACKSCFRSSQKEEISVERVHSRVPYGFWRRWDSFGQLH